MHLMKKLSILLIIALLNVFPANASQYPALRDSCDPALQKSLENCLTVLGLHRPVVAKSLCVVLVDITDPHHPRLASVNGDEMMYAASLPKIAILLAAFERVAQGKLSLNSETRNQLTRMIRNSSNQAATSLLDRVGRTYVNTTLKSHRYRLYDPSFNGGLWVGKDYGKSPPWNRDPLHNLSHGATALQVARFYYLLETGRLVTPTLSREMKAILAEPAIQHKFVEGLAKVHPDSRFYRKSGTWKNWHADSAIVEHAGRRYIVVALAASPEGEQWLRRLIVPLDEIIFQTVPHSSVSLDDKPQ